MLLRNVGHFFGEDPLERGIGLDYPFRVNVLQFTSYRPIESLLPWIHVDIEPYIFYYNINSALNRRNDPNPIMKRRSDMALKEIESRFNGHPKKTRFLISHKTANKKTFNHKDMLRQQVDAGSMDWKLYKNLATLYLIDELYDEAKSVLLKYPGLQNTNTLNKVAMSNVANNAGDLFFRLGATEHARFFYQMSADLDTGSGLCLSSKEKIALIDFDFSTALENSSTIARRYDNEIGYANYMTYLHLVGDHKTAWSLFKTLVTRYGEDHAIWTSALIGHRMEGKTQKEINQWLQTINQVADTDKMKSQLSRFAALCMMDRDPGGKVPEIVALYDRNVALNFHQIEGYRQLPDKMPFYTIFANGYELIKSGHYEEAHKLFSSFESFHFDNYWGYAAYAAMKAGKIKEIEMRLPRNPSKQYANSSDFTRLLAFAVFDCAAGNHDSAISTLKNAFAVRPPTEDNPYYTWYHLVELCEWMYEHTKEKTYINLALNWSRIFQKIQPMYGWAFAFEAQYAPMHDDKIKALAYALYLDPKSKRIAGLDDNIKHEARQWFNKNNAFGTHFKVKKS